MDQTGLHLKQYDKHNGETGMANYVGKSQHPYWLLVPAYVVKSDSMTHVE